MGTTTPSGESQARTLGPEPAALQEQNRLLHAEVVALRQQAHYHRSQHRRAVARAEELQAQVDVLKAKVAELQQRLFGRKSERSNRAPLLGGTEPSGVAPRARGQQAGRAGHGRTLRETLPVVEVVLELCDSELRCPYCGLAWDPFGPPQRSEQIEWEVRLFRRRTIRPKYRPAGRLPMPTAAAGHHLGAPGARVDSQGPSSEQFPHGSVGAEVSLSCAAGTHPRHGAQRGLSVERRHPVRGARNAPAALCSALRGHPGPKPPSRVMPDGRDAVGSLCGRT
jgi:hypothetical protein